MKRIFYALLAIAGAAGLTACNGASSLAEALPGSWAGTPQRVIDTTASSATVIETLTFTPDEAVKNGGEVQIMALLSVTGAVEGTEGINQPISLTASGYAAAKGTWQATSGDKILLSFNTDSMEVSVDPDAVLLSNNLLTSTDNSTVTALRPQLAASIRGQLREALVNRYAKNMELTNVDIDNNATPATLSFKYNKQLVKLTRQP